jgi:DNA polymerase/3'-5' exonuclease PolX
MPKEQGKIMLERAEKTARAIVNRLAPYCRKRPDGTPYIEVAGSIRRRQPWVNDIDIVLAAADPWNLHHEILNICWPFWPKGGKKVMQVSVNGIQVDFYFCEPETWATLLLIRTGSTGNNIRLCSAAKALGWHLHADGSGLFNEKGERIAGDSEESIYKALRLVYQVPEQRG